VDTKLAVGSPTEPAPFGKYLLLGLIARGGMAEVYRARPRSSPEWLFAIKRMRPQLAREPRFVDMFLREGKLARLLEHPAIVRTHDIGRVDKHYFIAMEYIGGRDLTQVLRKCQETGQRIPVPHAIYIALCMAEGLHYAHVRTDSGGRPLNIVNRDVSPSNVRISYDGEVKLLDFGIAQSMSKFTSEIGILKGKFSYMSPEQIRGLPVDARTDIFSVGIILHEMLTTEKLFRGDTEFALMERVRKAEVVPPSRFNRRVPEALDRVTMRALARDASERYQTAQQLADDLAEILENGGYGFSSDELRESIRALFRQDYRQEQAELAACLAAPVDGVGALSMELAQTRGSGEFAGSPASAFEAEDETPVVQTAEHHPIAGRPSVRTTRPEGAGAPVGDSAVASTGVAAAAPSGASDLPRSPGAEPPQESPPSAPSPSGSTTTERPLRRLWQRLLGR
jgi:serine/threonine protein kinase